MRMAKPDRETLIPSRPIEVSKNVNAMSPCDVNKEFISNRHTRVDKTILVAQGLLMPEMSALKYLR